MSRWEQLFKNIQQDFKLFIFIIGIITFFRIAFIIVLNSHLSNESGFYDILVSLYYGFRISFKTAGILIVPSLILCTLLNFLIPNKKTDQIRLWLGLFWIIVLSILFYVRIPYYKQFNMSFNQMLFNTFKDDTEALFYTIIAEYNIPIRAILLIITIYLLYLVLKKLLHTKTLPSPHFSRPLYTIAFRIFVAYLLWHFVIFLRYGGSMTYANDISWENSALTKDDFLNEAILDDVQALYRAYELHERLINSVGIDVDVNKITEYGSYIAGKNIKSDNLYDYLQKTAQGSLLTKPSHVFLIVSESYANWPLLQKYENLHIADDMKQIIESDKASYISAFLPNGLSTIGGVNGIISGLAEVNLYVNYQEQSFKAPYATALAHQMKKLGYNTNFWYAGPSSWERIKDFALSQGFDKFYGQGDFHSESCSVWGSDDKYLFNAVLEHQNNNNLSFDLILTVSNHSPYTLDLVKEGWDEQTIINGLPANQKDNRDLAIKLGHYWYATREMVKFIHAAEKKYPDSLFIIVGDHADRVNIQPNPDLYERYTIPFIVYGQGVTKDLIPKTAAGSHTNVAPTIIELVAPKGFTYYSVGESLTSNPKYGFNHGFWISSDYIGKMYQDEQVLPLPLIKDNAVETHNPDKLNMDITAMRAVSWWLIKYGSEIK